MSTRKHSTPIPVKIVDGTSGSPLPVMAVGTDGAPLGNVLAQSAVSVSHTGSLAETTLATVTVPANLIGANGQIEIVSLWSYTNSANNKTIKVKFGGTSFFISNMTTTANLQLYTRIANVNNTASQKGGSPGLSGGFGISSVAGVTSAVDTTSDVAIKFDVTLASAAETITLESYIIKVFPKD